MLSFLKSFWVFFFLITWVEGLPCTSAKFSSFNGDEMGRQALVRGGGRGGGREELVSLLRVYQVWNVPEGL